MVNGAPNKRLPLLRLQCITDARNAYAGPKMGVLRDFGLLNVIIQERKRAAHLPFMGC